MRKKRLAVLVIGTALLLSCSGCGSNSATSSSSEASSTGTTAQETESASDPAAMDTISMLVNYKATEAPAEDNPIILAIKDYTGTTLDITWVPQDAFEEKINTLMASQQLPQVTVIREIRSSGFINAARSVCSGI